MQVLAPCSLISPFTRIDARMTLHVQIAGQKQLGVQVTGPSSKRCFLDDRGREGLLGIKCRINNTGSQIRGLSVWEVKLRQSIRCGWEGQR